MFPTLRKFCIGNLIHKMHNSVHFGNNVLLFVQRAIKLFDLQLGLKVYYIKVDSNDKYSLRILHKQRKKFSFENVTAYCAQFD